MNDELSSLVSEAQRAFAEAADAASLENAKARFLGKSGAVTERLKMLGKTPPEQRAAVGAEINQAKQAIETALDTRRAAIAEARMQAQLDAEAIDVSLPGRSQGTGGLHPAKPH